MNVLLLGPTRSSFVKTDIKILSAMCRLERLDTSMGRGAQGGIKLIGITLKTIVKMFSCDVVYIWFADFYSLIPAIFGKILHKRVIVIAGGFDVGYIPELNYGARARKMRWFCVKNTFKYCSLILPVSQHAMRELDWLTERKHAPATMVYNGIDVSLFHTRIKDIDVKKIALTVSQADTVVEYIRKGIDSFIAAAKEAQDITFQVAGLTDAALQRAKQDSAGMNNVEIIKGPIAYSELPAYYYNAVAYCQFSLEETFGMAVVESMLCGCIPIVSAHGALPELVGDSGYIANDHIPFSDVITEAFQRNELFDCSKTRKQAEQFSIERRAERLKEVFSGIFK